MRRFVLFLLLWCASLPAWAGGFEWLYDAQAAQEKAKQENKLVLLDFTGSDWCGWCIKLKREVFDQPEFAEFAQSKLVMVEVDFPRNKAMAHLQRQGNVQLAKTYHVRGYPTIVVLNQDGQKVGEFGYVAGGPKAFIAKLQSVARIKSRIVQAPPPSEPEPRRKPVVFKPLPPAVPVHYGPLALKGISGTKDRRMVLINNASMMSGETAKVRTEDQEVVVCCQEIREDSVLITCDGKPMELKLPQH